MLVAVNLVVFGGFLITLLATAAMSMYLSLILPTDLKKESPIFFRLMDGISFRISSSASATTPSISVTSSFLSSTALSRETGSMISSPKMRFVTYGCGFGLDAAGGAADEVVRFVCVSGGKSVLETRPGFD